MPGTKVQYIFAIIIRKKEARMEYSTSQLPIFMCTGKKTDPSLSGISSQVAAHYMRIFILPSDTGIT